jgi:hypothetical protein
MPDHSLPVLQRREHGLTWLADRRAEWLHVFGDKAHYMANMVDNHDMTRFLGSNQTDYSMFM